MEKVGTKLYWYGGSGDILAETNSSGTLLNEYVYFAGRRVALLPSGGTAQLYVEDTLGSSRVVTTNTGSVCYDGDFTPFGAERAVTNSCTQNNYKFEGKERDTETSNDDFGARYYANRFGRWLSADWSTIPAPVPYANLTNPQALNLYSMSGDDPESFSDLDGHDLRGKINDSTAMISMNGTEERATIYGGPNLMDPLYEDVHEMALQAQADWAARQAAKQNVATNSQIVIVAIYDRTTTKYPADRNVTYAVYSLSDGRLTPIQGPNEILMYESVVSGARPNICEPCSNRDTPDLQDYKDGVFRDENSVQFGGSVTVQQRFEVNGHDALVFNKSQGNEYVGSYVQRVAATPNNITVYVPKGAYTTTAAVE